MLIDELSRLRAPTSTSKKKLRKEIFSLNQEIYRGNLEILERNNRLRAISQPVPEIFAANMEISEAFTLRPLIHDLDLRVHVPDAEMCCTALRNCIREF